MTVERRTKFLVMSYDSRLGSDMGKKKGISTALYVNLRNKPGYTLWVW